MVSIIYILLQFHTGLDARNSSYLVLSIYINNSINIILKEMNKKFP